MESAGPFTLPPLDACPLCRSSLSPAETPAACPTCGSDLGQYASLHGRAQQLLALAAEALVRGDSTLAEEVASGLELLVPPAGAGLALLRAKLALARSDWEGARAQLGQLDPHDARLIEEQITVCRRLVLESRELYNSALSACRAGEYWSALRLLGRACGLDAANTSIWSLRLKAALKAGDWTTARLSLSALQRLSASPEWLSAAALAAMPSTSA